MGAIDILKDAAKMAMEAKQWPLHEKILGLTDAMFDMQNENQELKHRIQQLQAEANLRERMEHDAREGVFYEVDEAGKKKGPYCPACWQEHSRPVFLVIGRDGRKRCTVCRRPMLF